GDAFSRLFDTGRLDAEAAFGIEGGILRTQAVSGGGDLADAAPFAVADFEDFEHALARSDVSLAGHTPHVLIFDFVATLCALANKHEDGFEKVERLEAADHKGDAEIAREFLVFGVTHDGSDMS